MLAPDIMARVTKTRTEPVVDEWRALLDRHARVTCALEHALECEHGLGLSEFEVLDHLAATEDHGCRMQSLTEALHLSQSALSRVVARLEADGLVERVMCKEDRRGIFAHLTPAGRARHAKARPTHRAVLRETLAA